MNRARSTARLLALPAAALTLALGLAGCTSDSQPVARVGTSVVTRGDYLAAAEGATAQYPQDPNAAKSMLLQDLVHRRLMVLAAKQRGLFDDTLTVNYRRLKEEDLLVQALNRDLSPTGNQVSDAEIREFYARRDSAARVQVIYVMTKPLADEVARLARSGEDFGKVADRFNPAGVVPPHGDIGVQPPGSLLAPLDEHVRLAAPGSVIGPLESPGQGWFVMRVGERVANPQPPFEQSKRSLADMIRQRKQRAALIRTARRLQESYALRTEPGAAQLVYAYLNLPEGEAPHYTVEDLERPLAQWETPDGTQYYRFGEGIRDLNTTGRQKPSASVLPSIEQWIIAESSRRLQIFEARRRGIDREPAFRRMLDETVNNYVLEGLYNSEIVDQAVARPGDAIEVYQRNQNRYENLDGITAQVIEFPDSGSAHAFTRHAGHGKDLRAAAAMVPGSPEVRDVHIKFPNPDPDWDRIHDIVRAMSEGEAMGPFRTRDGKWRIFLVLLKETHVTPYDKLNDNMRATLQEEGLQMAQERLLTSFLDGLRHEFPVQIDSAVEKKLPWPVPKPES